MKEFLRYGDALFLLFLGGFVLLFPQAMTKLPLTKPENAGTRRKLKNAGWGLLGVGMLFGLVRVLG